MDLAKAERDKQISLSDKDLMDLVAGKAKVVMYQQLPEFSDIEDFLAPHGAVFLLYQSAAAFGHWVAVFKRGDTIEFFDPYGLFPDSELKWTTPELRPKFNMDHTYLLRLLYLAPQRYQIVYNEHRFQKMDKKTNTCGRWSALRLHFRHLSLEDFVKKFDLKKTKSGLNDDIVTLMTEEPR